MRVNITSALNMKQKHWLSFYLVLVLYHVEAQSKRSRVRGPRLLKGLPVEWHRFRNLSSIPGTFPCSEEERSCFKYGRLLHVDYDEVTKKTVGNCYPVGVTGPCARGSLFHVDVAEATRHGGRLRGTCQFPCGYSFRAELRESDGRCLWKRTLQEKLCGSHLGKPVFEGQTTRRVWGQWGRHNGQWECECSGPPCPEQPPLPPADRSCVAPDLGNPATLPPFDFNVPPGFTCSKEEINCIINIRRVFFQGKCFESLTQGPCANGEWLISPQMEPLSPMCKKRPCPQGQLPYAGKCISEEEIRTHLCPRKILQIHPLTGEWGCSDAGMDYVLIYSHPVCTHSRCNACDYKTAHGFAVGHLEFNCARDDLGSCALSAITQAQSLTSIHLEEED